MKLWLLLPVKPFHEGKSRLAEVLSVEARRALNRQMFLHVVQTALAAQVLAGVAVISRDPAVLAAAEAADVHCILEQQPGLNPALTQGQQWVLERGADALLVLPSDLPRLQTADVRSLATLSQPAPIVVLAPSQDGGTSALLLRPPQSMPFAFGVNSFQRHYEQAQRAGLPCHIYRSTTLAFDVDQPEDLAQWRNYSDIRG
jgi:2-phospho-L-lactate guanylyltransferase